MPIHLPPLSRRQFLIRSAAFIGSLAVAPHLVASDGRDPHHWALMADTHIAADRKKIARGINLASHFQSVCNEILERKESISGVLINGDCAYGRGTPGDYRTFNSLIKPLRNANLPLHCTLGNHDHRDNFLAASIAEKSTAGAVFQKQISIIETPYANWFLLDSLDKTNSTPGLFGDEQRKWLARELDARPRKPAIVVAHHQLDTTLPGALMDTNETFEVLRPRKQVAAYICGHRHIWNIKTDASGIHLINLPSAAYVFDPANPIGWVEAHLRKDAIQLQLHCLDRTHKEHGKKIELKWRNA